MTVAWVFAVTIAVVAVLLDGGGTEALKVELELFQLFRLLQSFNYIRIRKWGKGRAVREPVP